MDLNRYCESCLNLGSNGCGRLLVRDNTVLFLICGESSDQRGLFLNSWVIADAATSVSQELLVDALQRCILLDLRSFDTVAMVFGVLILR
jgi:hypothetical protein